MKTITVTDSFQQNYTYQLQAKLGDFEADFNPQLTPKEMLSLGVFGGAYFDADQSELPSDWFAGVVLSADGKPKAENNFFQVMASQSLQVWQQKGWIYPEDPRGWFQWYCRYYLGRRIKDEDTRQIKRWRAFARHAAQVKKFCEPGDLSCRRGQRQALLHWAYDSQRI